MGSVEAVPGSYKSSLLVTTFEWGGDSGNGMRDADWRQLFTRSPDEWKPSLVG